MDLERPRSCTNRSPDATHLVAHRGEMDAALRRVVARLRDSEMRKEFAQVAWTYLLEHEPSILAKLDSRNPAGYLVRVLERVLVTWLRSERGRWRPSEFAKERGVVAIELERLIGQHGFSANEAVEMVLCRSNATGRDELEELVGQLRPKRRRVFVPEETIALRPAAESAECVVADAEVRALASLVLGQLSRLIGSLGAEDRAALVAAYRARRLDRSQSPRCRPAYGRVRRIRERLARGLRAAGISAGDSRAIIERQAFDSMVVQCEGIWKEAMSNGIEPSPSGAAADK